MEISPTAGRLFIILTVGAAFCDLSRLDLVGYDDVAFIGHPAIEQGIFSAEAIRHAFTSTTLWHPITWLSHALDRDLFGTGVAGPHLLNGVFHLGSCLLLFGWLRRHVGTTAFALVVTLLFAVHPLRVESVAWLAERKDVLATFFYLGAVYAYSIWATDRTKRRAFWIAVLSAVLGTLSKPSLMTLPIALLLLDAWPFARLQGELGRRLLEKWPFFLLSIASVVVTLAFFSQDTLAISLGFGDRIGLSALTIATYTWRTFWPAGLTPFEPMNLMEESWLIALSVVFLVAASWGAIRYRATHPAIWIGWLWWLALLLPVSGIAAQADHFAPDRYTYLAHVGLFIALVSALETLARSLQLPRNLMTAATGAVVLLLVLLTFQQVAHWKNAETLWRHTIAMSRKNYVAHHQLGLHLLGTERSEEGLTHLRIAVEATPGFSIPRGNLALALARNGHPEDALVEFQKAGPELPQREKFIEQLVQAFTDAGATAALSQLLDLQLRESPEAPEPLYRRALIHLTAREIPSAMPLLQRALTHAEPDSPLAGRAHHALAQAYTLTGAFAEALDEYAAAIPLTDDLPVVRQEYAQLLLNAPDPALRDAPTALDLMKPLADSDNPRFLRTLVQAKLANQLEAAPDALRALDVIAQLRESDPLPQPWTEPELAALQVWFQQRASEP